MIFDSEERDSVDFENCANLYGTVLFLSHHSKLCTIEIMWAIWTYVYIQLYTLWGFVEKSSPNKLNIFCCFILLLI